MIANFKEGLDVRVGSVFCRAERGVIFIFAPFFKEVTYETITKQYHHAGP